MVCGMLGLIFNNWTVSFKVCLEKDLKISSVPQMEIKGYGQYGS